MTQSIFRHRIAKTWPRWSADDVGRRMFLYRDHLRKAYHRDPLLFLWRLLWFPFWVGSDAPPPALPVKPSGDAAPLPADPAGVYLTGRVDRITRFFKIAWIVGALLRGLTLSLLALAIWIGLAVAGLAGVPGWWAAGAVVTGGVALGGIHGWLVKPNRLMVAEMFDRTFGLRERIATAFDRPADLGYVSRLQLADAANTFDEIATEIPRSSFLPVREAAMCLIVTGALVTLLLAYVPRQAIAGVEDSPVPQFVPASERLAARDPAPPPPPLTDQPVAERATIAEIQERGRQSQSAREDLARIGDALRDHPITQPAADSIASADYAAAADSLRSASESAGAMSPESREALAQDLEQAAREISGENPELAQAANEAAAGLREGGPEAESALSELADQIEQTGSEVESQADLARDLDEAQSGSSDPSSSNDGSQGESPGSSQSQASSQQGAGDEQAASDPGEGSSAQPGVSNQPQESSESASGSGSSEGSSEEGGGASSEGAGEQPSESQSGEGSGEPSSSGSGSEGDGSSQSQAGSQGGPDEETSASQGSGAGTGQSGANDQNTSDSAVDAPASTGEEDPEAEVPGAGEAGDPPPSRADRGEADDATGTTSQGSSNLELQGTSDSGIQTGGDSGSSSLGSGTGSTTASGEESAGEVGVAGPDSNRVPDALRDVVRDFFGGPEE